MKKAGHRGKRALAAALLLAVLTMLTGCGVRSASRYEYAQELMAMREYEAAVNEFQQLGEYRDSGRFALYTAALIALNTGELDVAEADFDNLRDFKSSQLYLEYVKARELEQDEDYPNAQSAYGALGSFQDSRERLETCTAMIPKQAYEAAKTLFANGEYEKSMEAFLALKSYGDSAAQAENCQQAILSQEYQMALGLFRSKDYQGALEAFAALGSFRDSAMQAEACRQAIFDTAEAARKTGDLDKVQEAIALYQALDKYRDADKTAQELKTRYAVNLQLRSYQESSQYVLLGSYPQGTGSEKAPILWRVLSVNEGTALLLSEKILDAVAFQSGGNSAGFPGSTLQTFLNGAFLTEAFTAAEQAALVGNGTLGRVSLLSKEQAMDPGLGFMDDASRQAPGTEYALSKGLNASTEGKGWWWLSSPGENAGCQVIVYYNGKVYGPGLHADDAGTGVRPAVEIKLTSLFFTKGTGTAQDPFAQ